MLTFAYIVGGWVWQDAYVIKKSPKKLVLKKHLENDNFKSQKLVEKLHDVKIKNNFLYYILHFEVALTSKVNMASKVNVVPA